MSLKSHYCIIRYVPDLVRNEGVNIGLALEIENNGETRKQFRFAESFQRAAKLDPITKTALLEKNIKAAIEQINKESEVLDLTSLISNFSGGKVQLTEARFALLDDIERELEGLFAQFVIDEKEERHHGKTDPILKKEVRETLRRVGINGDRVKYSTNKEPVFLKGKISRHLFDMSIQVNHHHDFIRCISFDVEHHNQKLDAAKVLVYDNKDIREQTEGAEVVSILYPPKVHGGKKPLELFKEAWLILNDEGIPAFNFDLAKDRERLIERIKPSEE
jgi:hypothetical protein